MKCEDPGRRRPGADNSRTRPSRRVPTTPCFILLLGIASAGYGGFAKLPYIQNLTDSSVVVRWETSVPESGSVQYGLTTAYGREISDPNPDSLHELVLEGLEPDTAYYYRVLAGPDTSPDARFHTPAAPGRPIRFCAYGDTHGDSTTQQSVVDRMELVEPGPGLLLHCGDVTASGSKSQYRLFFDIEHLLLAGIPLFPALGNHDVDSSANWHRFFCLPGNERWYATRYGSSVFLCLNSNLDHAPGSEQYQWLLSELLADSANPAIRHIFVWFHYPAYTTNNAYAGDTIARQHLCPLFERFGVRIVFSGHVHAYEHSLVNGVHYLTVGGGGATLSGSWGPAQPWTVYREATYHFALLDVRGDTVFCRGVKPSGAVFDSFALTPAQTRIAGPGTAPGTEARVAVLRAASAPSRGAVELRFTLSSPGTIRLAVYDACGRIRAVLATGCRTAGENRVVWNTGSVPAGVYACRLEAAGAVSAARIVLAR